MSIIYSNFRQLSELLPVGMCEKSAEEFKVYDQLLQILNRVLENIDSKQDIEAAREKLRECKEGGAISQKLTSFNLFLKALEAAISEFEGKNFEKFDANVGENSCQIRVVKLALMASKSFEEVKRQLPQVKERVKQVQYAEVEKSVNDLANYLRKVDLDRKILLEKIQPIQCLMRERDLNIFLSEDELFLVGAYILSEINEEKPAKQEGLCRKELNLKKLSAFGNLSSTQANYLVKDLKAFLSKASVEFVQGLAKELEDEDLISMCSKVINHEKLTCMPMFYSCKTLLLKMQEVKMPLVFKAGGQSLFFPAIDAKARKVGEEDVGKVAMVVEGAGFLNAQMSPFEVILAGAADHRQYPNGDGAIDEKIEEYKYYKTESSSSKKYATFFIRHIYATRVGRS